MPFKDLDLSTELTEAITNKFKQPTKIQAQTVPIALANKDIVAIAQTGSGKTLAFGWALIEQLYQSSSARQAVIIAPTRELATQIHQSIKGFSDIYGLSLSLLTGGVDKESQLLELSKHPQLIVATPGRLLDLLKGGFIQADHIQTVVLDEADRLLGMGFWPDIKSILSLLPTKRQTLMFSATLPDELGSQVSTLLTQPVVIETNSKNTVVEQIEERLYLVNKGSKVKALIHQLELNRWPQALVFISAKDNADALCKKLNKAGIVAAALHGNKQQVERTQTLADFQQNKVRVLVATDVLARGVHVDKLPVVINMELPSDPSIYVHRVGRTARAGEEGLAISLVCHGESDYLQAIRNLTQRTLSLKQLEGFPVTDQPSTGQSKRPKRDKQANRRTSKKSSIKQFKTKAPQR